jgi:hypothetical protein
MRRVSGGVLFETRFDTEFLEILITPGWSQQTNPDI